MNQKLNNILEIAVPLNERKNNEPLRVLSEEDWKFWKENGYVIIRDAVPKDHIYRLARLIWKRRIRMIPPHGIRRHGAKSRWRN
ncbi:hypothetical protein [Fictibacillus sp. NRS-1165]|uniref:hypothetical protein n=1 Tax=Fictibacillus sp. NRS-1165 TaxID=3144463 RepID=UPI003D26086F